MSMDHLGNRMAPTKECPPLFAKRPATLTAPGKTIYVTRSTPEPEPIVIPAINAPPIHVTTTIESIGPDRARELLALSTGNRNLRSGHIKFLAQQMLDHCWRIGPASIAISTSDRLLDGHHRLHAIIQSKQTIDMIIMRGLPDICWDAIDCGAARNTHDRFVMPGKNGSEQRRAAAIINNILTTITKRKRKATTLEISNCLTIYESSITFLVTVHKAGHSPMTSPVIFAIICQQLHSEPAAQKLFTQGLLGDPAGHSSGLELRKLIREAYLSRRIGTMMNRDWMRSVTQSQIEKYMREYKK